MRFNQLKNKLWFKIFIRTAAIFAAFLLVLYTANAAFLPRFFTYKQKNLLKEQLLNVCSLKLNDSQTVLSTISDINEKYNFEVEIYSLNGEIEYSTKGKRMKDFFGNENGFPDMHEDMIPESKELLGDGVTFETARRPFDSTEYLVCTKQINSRLFARVSIQKQLLADSAETASEFILIIALIFFAAALLWTFLFAKKFANPINEMSEITKDMANLNFERKLDIESSDEVGQLAKSVNLMSDSLSNALESLKSTNEKLINDIELERRLDTMRKEFIANVSHELKTPISIISGYAEGLKLNVNPQSRESYCDTIIEESKRMNKLVLSILELSKYESGQIPINKQNFDISVLCSDMLKRIFKGSDILTENRIPENTVCFADSLLIEQVLKSLLENALAHTNPGGKVTVYSQTNGDIITVNVHNTGSHIDDSLMPDIWQSFFRGEQSHKRESSRFGLGLSIVAAVMKMHERNCGVYNTDNGVCFWFEVKN